MNPKVLFIGSIGTVAETSEIQRQAYNQALKENGLDWEWDKETYKELLMSNGGQDRLELLGNATGTSLSEDQIISIHSRKTKLAGDQIVMQNVQPRPGLSDLIRDAKADGMKIAWVTTTGKENIEAILKAFDGTIKKNDFDHIFYRNDAERGKPFSDIYETALEQFKVTSNECIAIEDSLNSLLAAKNTGIFTVVTLGKYHDEQVDNIADLAIDSLSKISWNKLKQDFSNQKITIKSA